MVKNDLYSITIEKRLAVLLWDGWMSKSPKLEQAESANMVSGVHMSFMSGEH